VLSLLTLGRQRADTFFASTEVAKNPKKLATKLSRALLKLHDHIREALQPDTLESRRCASRASRMAFDLRCGLRLHRAGQRGPNDVERPTFRLRSGRHAHAVPRLCEFTEGAFVTIFENARELDCSYQ
jgi:hypothetical protein